MQKLKLILNAHLEQALYKKYKDDAGYDVFMPYSGKIRPFQTLCLNLGIRLQVPRGYACITIPRSSSAKKGLFVQDAIIDCGYTGDIHLIITNLSKKTIYWNFGDRLASLVFFKVNTKLVPKYVGMLKETHRGNSGLGSSGK